MSNTIGLRKLESPAVLRKCAREIGQRELKRARLAAGFVSQEAAAIALGVDPDTICRQECGDVKVSGDIYFALREIESQQRKTGT